MFKSLFQKGAKLNVSRWVVLLIDIVLVVQCFIFAYLIVFNFQLNFQRFGFFSQIILVSVVSLICFLIVGSYRGTVRQTGIKDAQNIFYAVSLLFIALLIITLVDRNYNFTQRFAVPFRVITVNYLLNIIILIASRYIFKRFIQRVLMAYKPPKNTLIYGAGDSGMLTYTAINSDINNSANIVGFIDDDKKKRGKKYNRVKVYSSEDITKEFIKEKDIKEIIVSIHNIKPFKLFEIVDNLLPLPAKVKVVPPVDQWIDGDLNVGQLTEVKIEDLLNRTPIKINNPILQKELDNKVILITGAAGSIGSEIAHQIGNYNYKQLILLDQAESDLYNIQQSFYRKKRKNFSIEVADISNQKRMSAIFNKYNIEMIFHAAAYKHVPLMEENPYEAVRVNVFGARTIMDLALKNKVEKFVMVSTDKAVNPTNVMGATKRVAEVYANCLNTEGKTKFITTRFGNVLGSNGSVIPLFKKQIAEGGPIQVTHKEITRYFMTISEACSLVLEAGVMGKGGEIYVFDMGESVKIYDLAKKMIHLSGLKFPDDIDIKIVGLRPGEKLYEELLTNEENTIPTYNEKIMIAKVDPVDYKVVKSKIVELSKLDNMDNYEIVSKMKSIVKEYISNNSEYERLDGKESAVHSIQ
ncbi:nucleoside-diphosphate sugar epimerase/dehydratase [Aureibaculum sp. 2210JD6-5]|uniref:polysaccharide biosynthesis protein n=1 Tax=Aureibaculum sp. 2210JD6-5 TaxID=3103957 RepID=UPI002AAC4F5A|nr:nucleoside-diphosphate sugar epimerase/dehydratase [Aureibaculum sp. 2210JD6-5]MDY7394188.1 nucleoside-diphosphate sugar epimerase/dehydratase [Aureibaculum sp. 2210JD6-5]